MAIKFPPKDVTFTINNNEAISLKIGPEQSGIQNYYVISALKKSAAPARQTLIIKSDSKSPLRIKNIRESKRFSAWHLLSHIRSDLFVNPLLNSEYWLTLSGFTEANLVAQDACFISALNKVEEGKHYAGFHKAIWEMRNDVQNEFNLITSPSYIKWLRTHGRREYNLPPIDHKGNLLIDLPKTKKYSERPFGVNLFGYASSTLGIGEDVRTCQEALERVGVPTAIIDISTKHASKEQREKARKEFDSYAPYAFNLICMTAEEHARIVLELGLAVFNERYNIGYWPWELSKWPREWLPFFGLVDEIWGSSRHTYHAIKESIGKNNRPSTLYIPLGVSRILPITTKKRISVRNTYELPRTDLIIICSFDGRSSFWRKNPWGAIQAFQRAFPIKNDFETSLVIKTLHASVDPDEWEKLNETAKHDQRIQLIDASLSREEILNLYGCCDVLLSMHRAEGFGRILAESLLLGLDVVATNYSGSTDFCHAENYYPIDYELTSVPDGAYPYAAGQEWAEPSVDHAAHLLTKIYSKRKKAQSSFSKEEHLQMHQRQLSTETVGKNYKARLLTIWNDHKKSGKPDLQLSRKNCLYGLED